MKVLPTTCLLFALLPTGASLICYHCAGSKEACKNAMRTPCVSKEYGCVTVSYAVFFGDSEHLVFSEKKCALLKSWRGSNSTIATANHINFAAKGRICQTDLCNMDDVTLARPSESEENGRICPATITFNSENYDSKKTISCRGHQTKCLHVGGSIETPVYTAYNFVLRGCATPDACALLEGNMQAARGVFTANFTHMECTDAPMGASTPEEYATARHSLWSFFHEDEAKGSGTPEVKR